MAANNVNALAAQAAPLVDDITHDELTYMLKSSEILRSVLKTDPSSFSSVIAHETLVLKGPRLEWLIDHATHIRDTMDVLSSDKCPENTYIDTPETKATMNYAEPAAFRFLQHYTHEEPLGEYTEKDGKVSITLFPIFSEGLREDIPPTAHLANVLDYLMWNHRTPQEQVNDLIECGLLVKESRLHHSFPNKEAKLAALAASSSSAAFNNSILNKPGNWNNINVHVESNNNRNSKNRYNNNEYIGENEVNYSAIVKPHMKKMKPSKSYTKRKVNRKCRGTRRLRSRRS